MTPNIATIVRDISSRWAFTDLQYFNCRLISGTLTWSQHAYSDEDKDQFGNAVDVMSDSAVLLDEVVAYVRATYASYVAHLLWRVKDHGPAFPPMHFHLDTWPQGYAPWPKKPPCKGGTLRVKHQDGKIGTQFTDDIPGEEPEPMFPITPESEKEDIRLLQDRLNRVYGAGLSEDGIYGDTTKAAVRLFLGKMTGDPVAADGGRVVANQWNGMTEEWIRRLAGAGGVTEARVRQLIEASRIVT